MEVCRNVVLGASTRYIFAAQNLTGAPRSLRTRQVWTNNKVCHKLFYEVDRLRHAVLASNASHKSLANGSASVACNIKVCLSLQGMQGHAGTRQSARPRADLSWAHTFLRIVELKVPVGVFILRSAWQQDKFKAELTQDYRHAILGGSDVAFGFAS